LLIFNANSKKPNVSFPTPKAKSVTKPKALQDILPQYPLVLLDSFCSEQATGRKGLHDVIMNAFR